MKEKKVDYVGFEPTTSCRRVMRSMRATPVPTALGKNLIQYIQDDIVAKFFF
jgi:hypothetical protein